MPAEMMTPSMPDASTSAGSGRRRTSVLRAVRRFRRRHIAAGLCHCGRPRREATVGSRPAKTCDRCYARSHAERGTYVPSADRVPLPPVPPRSYVKLTVEHSPEHVAEWQGFCDEFDMPLQEAMESAMELLIALTRREERQAEAQTEDARFLRLEA